MKSTLIVVLSILVSAAVISSNAIANLEAYSPIPHFEQVIPGIYRGGRPNKKGLDYVKKLGVRTIINIENDVRAMRAEAEYASRLGIQWFAKPMSAGKTPNDNDIRQLLEALQDTSRFPIFIHCKHGQDRTGLVLGLYRVFVQKWTPAQAYQEMLRIGFHPQYDKLDGYFRAKTGYKGPVPRPRPGEEAFFPFEEYFEVQ